MPRCSHRVSRGGVAFGLITGRRELPRISNTLLRSSEALSWVIQQGYAGTQDQKELREARQAAFADALGLAARLPGSREGRRLRGDRKSVV